MDEAIILTMADALIIMRRARAKPLASLKKGGESWIEAFTHHVYAKFDDEAKARAGLWSPLGAPVSYAPVGYVIASTGKPGENGGGERLELETAEYVAHSRGGGHDEAESGSVGACMVDADGSSKTSYQIGGASNARRRLQCVANLRGALPDGRVFTAARTNGDGTCDYFYFASASRMV